MEYRRALKAFIWGIAGLIVSFSFMKFPQFKFIFSYPFLILSCLMFVLAAYQFYRDNKK